MNKSAFYILLTLSSLLFILTSCDDNTNPIPDNIDNYPMTIGNYCIFNTYELDANHQKIYGTEKRDSIVVEQKLIFEDKTGFLLAVYRDKNIFDTLYIAIEPKKIYMMFDENDIDVPNIKRQWFLIADFSKTSTTEWHNYDSVMTDFPYYFEDSIINTTYHHTVNGRFEYEENFPYNNLSIKSKIFHIKYDTRLYFIYKFSDDISTTEVEVNRIRQKNIHFAFAENIGLVRMKYDPYLISIRTNPSTNYSKYENHTGWQSDLIDYRLITLETQ